MKHILQSYLRRLTNLTTRNKSLLLLRLKGDHFIDIHEFNFLLNQASFQIISSIISQKKEIPLCKVADPRDTGTNLSSKKLKALDRSEKYIFEERGSKDLYVGWPFVKGKFSDGTLVRCPLVFFPVKLFQKDNTWMLTLREDVSITFNKSFVLAYAYYNGVKLREEFIELTLDDLEKDSKSFRTAIYKLLKESPLEINFNQETFLDELGPFKEYTKNEFKNYESEGILKLHQEAVLGIFPQAGSYLVPDYLHLIEEDSYEDIETFFAARTLNNSHDIRKHSAEYYHFLNKSKEEDTFSPFKLDAHQENALKAVKKGNSIVVQGPPGTGKSQLICNLVSDFIARGKRVLVVCQKRAALDVVYDRLFESEISDFVALVHDFKNDRKTIFDKIQNQIERIYEYKIMNGSLDAIQLERTFLHASRRIDQITEEFEEFKEILFDENEAGISVKELYLNSDRDAPAINLKQEYRNFIFERIPTFEQKLRTYFEYNKKFNKEGYTWRHRKRFTGYGLEDLNNIKSILRDIPAFQEEISKKVEKLLGSGMELKVAEKIFEDRENLKEMLRHLKDDLTYMMFQHIIKTRDISSEHFPELLWLTTMRRTLMGCFAEPGPEISIPTRELGAFQKALSHKMKSRRNLFAHLKWMLFSKDKAWINKVLTANHLRKTGKDYRKLEKMVDFRLNLEHNITKLKGVKWLTALPEFYLKDLFDIWFERAKDAVTSYLIFDSYRNFKEYFNTSSLTRHGFTEKVNALYSIIMDIPDRMKKWRVYLRDARIDTILGDSKLNEKMIADLNDDFDALCDFDNLKSELAEFERTVIDRLLEFREYQSASELVDTFLNSLRLAWIDHIETKFPILRSINSMKHNNMQAELRESIKQKLKISRSITLLKARERTYANIEFNRLNNMVTYRELAHQVAKKRQIWPIRKLVQNFENELFDLLPCWMASPEVVSAIFPMEKLFDLVIFDEASQCFAEQGIPAMYRGKQIVVTGDSMQLSPFDLYKVRWEEDDNQDDISLEVDSLLDLSGQHLMQMQLRGHYRSKSLDLIEFSNQHFYNGKLTLLPDKKVLDLSEPAINFVKVDGIWDNQTNKTEAEKIAEIVQELIQKHPDMDIGIVTFNARQQDLLMDVLEEKAAENGFLIPESLFIKNIENVQGDERDIIIFSIGYAPDEKGRLNLHFGSLNVQKGENRLNVAVTRAREKIIVVSSIWPQQLRVDDTKNEGPKLFKKYLEYAMNVSSGSFQCTPPALLPHRTDWYLKHKLQKIWDQQPEPAFQLIEEMPFADLTVKNGKNYLGLILTDDDLYHQSISIKEMHIYTPFTLLSKNWRFEGIYSREYWHNKEAVKERLLKFAGEVDSEN